MADPVGFPTLRQVVLDATDTRGVAEFYRALLGFRYRPGDEAPAAGEPDKAQEWLVLSDEDETQRLASGRGAASGHAGLLARSLGADVRPAGTVPNIADLDRQHRRVLDLGGELLADRADDPEEPLRVYADPAGHPFCIFVRGEDL